MVFVYCCVARLYYSCIFLGSNDIFGCYLIHLTVLLEVFSTIVAKNAIIVQLKKMLMCIILLAIFNLSVLSAAKI